MAHGGDDLLKAVDQLAIKMSRLCGKRSRIYVDGDRPRKLRRLEGGVRIASDPIFPDAVMYEASDAVVEDFRPMYGGLVTVFAYAGTASVFDWATLRDALNDDDWVGQPGAGDPLFVFVPGAASEVTISKHTLLEEIAKKLHLRLHEWKVVLEPTGMYRACIEMDVPAQGAAGLTRRERFYGDDEMTRNDALESASESAVDHLRLKCNVILKDANYGQLKALERKCANAEDFNGLFLDLISAKEKNLEAMYAGFKGMILNAKCVCKESMDVLPIRFVKMDGPSGRAGNCGVVYDGMSPPVSSLDKIAYAMAGFAEEAFKLLQNHGK